MTSLLNLFRKRCVSFTEAGERCKRNTEKNSDYCWQHAHGVANILLDEGINESQVAEILQYAGEYVTANLDIQTVINRNLKDVIKWYVNNNFKPDFYELPENQIQYVVNVYNHRFPDDSLNPDYVVQLDKSSGDILSTNLSESKSNDIFFNPYIFFSKPFRFYDKEGYKLFKRLYFMANIDDNKIMKIFEKHTKEKLRVGDVLIFTERESGMHERIFDGKRFLHIPSVYNNQTWKYYISNIIFKNNIPHNNYFQYSIECQLLSYSLDVKFDEPKIVHITPLYNIWQMKSGWKLVVFSDFMNNILSGEYKIKTGTPELIFVSSYNSWINGLKQNIDIFRAENINRGAPMITDNVYDFYFKPLMEKMVQIYDEKENKIYNNIKKIRSSKILIESINQSVIRKNLNEIKDVIIDGKTVSFHNFYEGYYAEDL
jgi:hypothetical protein